MLQRTIKESVRVEGVHVYPLSGESYAHFHPAEENKGINFYYKGERIPANLERAFHPKKKINLEKFFRKCVALRGTKNNIYLTEHLLGAVYASGIDNLDIELSRNACPTIDNCGRDYYEALRELVCEQSAVKRFWKYSEKGDLSIRSPVNMRPDCLTVKEDKDFVVNCFAYYPHKMIKNQSYSLDMQLGDFEDIIDARPPGFIPNGLFKKAFLFLGKKGIHGLNERNYLWVCSKKEENYSNPEQPRRKERCFVEHKVLDVLGELALTGHWFKETKFEFYMTGHQFDLFALRELFEGGSFEEVH